MRSEFRQNSNCPLDEISAYIDGELTSMRELEIEAHFAACPSCTAELNMQKQFLLELDGSLRQEAELDLPANFTRNVVANAESAVEGLRKPRERFNALFICAGLLIFGLFALGPDAGQFFEGLAANLEQAGAVGGVAGRVVYSIFLGFAVIVRNAAGAMSLDESSVYLITAVFAVAALTFISRRAVRTHRA